LKRFTKVLAAGMSALVFSMATGATAPAATITVAPTGSPGLASCFPFGIGTTTGGGEWTPYAAFIYKNIPAFELEQGDFLAFDTNVAENQTVIQLEIAMARTTVNGGDVNAQAFQTVVTNTQTPADPNGDAINGSFELRFTAEQPFSFPGGGLIIRFTSPSVAYQADNGCNSGLLTGDASDPSGFFVNRAFRDLDGNPPWTNPGVSPVAIGAFQLTTTDPDTAAPDTQITKGPKDKTKKKQATFEFAGSDARALAGFECSLDGAAFAACTSPHTVKVKKGKHNFQVRATDQAGNADPTPASDDWKRKKKKKKK
jgi:hypothetical protein